MSGRNYLVAFKCFKCFCLFNYTGGTLEKLVVLKSDKC